MPATFLTNKRFYIPAVALLLTATFIFGTLFQEEETSLSLRIGDGYAAGVTFKTFHHLTGRIEALGRYSNSKVSKMQSLQNTRIGTQVTLFWHKQVSEAVQLRAGPALELSYIHHEYHPQSAPETVLTDEGFEVTPWIAAEAGWAPLRRVEPFISLQCSPHIQFGSYDTFEVDLLYRVDIGIRLFVFG